MPNKNNKVLFEDVLKDLLRWFKNSKGEFLIIGGIAVSLMTRPRTTQDIDVLTLLDESYWEKFLKQGSRFGFEPRIQDSIGFAKQNRVLLLRHRKSAVSIDISFGLLPFEEESMRRKILQPIGTLKVPLPTPEDLIIMKMIAHRPQDLIDVQHIVQSFPHLDRKRVEKWVKEFASVLDNPDLLTDLKKYMRSLPK